MRPLKKILILLISFVAFLGLGSFSSRAAEDDLGKTLVSSYGIPEEVLQAICDNSYFSDGTKLATRAMPKTLTIDDIKDLQIFSVADRKLKADGTFESTTNPVVASWVSATLDDAFNLWKAAQNGSGAISDYTLGNTATDFIYNQNLTEVWGNTSNTPEYLLTKGVKLENGTFVKLPKLNALLAVASLTGQNLIQKSILTTIDLTGVLSEVKIANGEVPKLRTKFFSLLRTKKMLNLTTLNLANNQIGLDFVNEGDATFILANGILNSSSIRNLNLSQNSIQEIDYWLLRNIAGSLNKLDLSSNDIKMIVYTNGDYFDQILDEVSGASNIDISGNGTIDLSNDQVRHVLIGAVNSKGQNVSMDDNTANELIIAGLDKKDTELKAEGLLTILDQMNVDTFQKVIASDSIPWNGTSLLSEAVIDRILKADDENNLILQLNNKNTPESKALLKQFEKFIEPNSPQKELFDKLLNKGNVKPINSIQLSSDSLKFGNSSIKDIQANDFTQEANNPLTISGNLISGFSLNVFASPWENANDKSVTISPKISFSLTGEAGQESIILDTRVQNKVLIENNTTADSTQPFNYTVSDGGKFTLSDINKNAQPGTYSGTITWEFSNNVSPTIK